MQLSKNRSDGHADDYKVMLVYSYTEHSSLHDHVLSAEEKVSGKSGLLAE